MNHSIRTLCLATSLAVAGAASAQDATTAANAAAPAMQDATPSAAELEFRRQLLLDSYAHVQYLDAEGKPVTFEDILRAIPTGKSFSIHKDGTHTLATVQLDGGGPRDKPGSEGAETLQVGTPLPPPEALRTLDGHALGAADLHGRRTLLSFYFAECLPCIEEIPELNRLAAAHPDMGVYAITFDDTATAKAFVAQRGLQVPVVADAQDYLDALGVRSYPTLLLVDEQGRIAAVRHGGNVRIGGAPAASNSLEGWVAGVR
jgi:peroxiredoxin